MIGTLKKRGQPEPFTQIVNSFIESPNLKGRAKWVFIYLWSKPEGWIVRTTDIAKHCMDGEKSIKADMIELQKAGYLKHERIIRANGQNAGTHWTLSQKPVQEWIKNYGKKPQGNMRPMDYSAKKPQGKKPQGGKAPCISNTEISNKEKNESARVSSTKAKANRGQLAAIVTKAAKQLTVRPPSSLNAKQRKVRRDIETIKQAI